jgi:hypothetical protein
MAVEKVKRVEKVKKVKKGGERCDRWTEKEWAIMG